MTQLNPNWIQALTYSARLDRQVVKAMYTEGVISGMKVAQRGAGANMSVDIPVGVGVIYGDDQADQGAYLVTCTVLENVVIAAAPGSNSRRDLVYWRINDPNAGGPAGSNSAFGVVTGTAAASPTLPALPTSAIPLAEVLVTAGDVTVVTAKITTLRVPAYTLTGIPPGFATPWFGTEALVPTDCVLLNGQALNKDTDWRLFFYYGTTYGSTSTTFNVPDLRGRSPVGLDNMGGSDAGVLSVANTLGAVGGEEKHTLTIAELAAHAHFVDPPSTAVTINDPQHSHAGVGGGGKEFQMQRSGGAQAYGTAAGSLVLYSTPNTDVASTGITATVDIVQFTSANNGTDVAHNNMQPYVLCNWIVKR